MPLSPKDPDYNAIMRQHRKQSQTNRDTPQAQYRQKLEREKAKRNNQN